MACRTLLVETNPSQPTSTIWLVTMLTPGVPLHRLWVAMVVVIVAVIAAEMVVIMVMVIGMRLVTVLTPGFGLHRLWTVVVVMVAMVVMIMGMPTAAIHVD
jgi:hypothetical protein